MKSATGGFLSITAAKLWFIVGGYAVQFALPHLLSERDFGRFSGAMSNTSMLNMVLIAATLQAVSKLVSESQENTGGRLRQALRIQLLLGGFLCLSAVALAPAIATHLLHDPTKAPLIQATSPVFLFYALYACLVGSLNGRRLFGTQAKLDMAFTTLRTTGIIGAAALGLGPVGALLGFSTAAACVLAVALAVVGLGAAGQSGVPLRRFAALMAPLFVYQAAINGMLQIDQAVLTRIATDLGSEAGMAADQAAAQADIYVAHYRAAQTFAFVPYQLIQAIVLVVFPNVSHVTTSGTEEETKALVRGAMRFALLVLLAFATPIAGAADGVMRIAYKASYLVASDALRVLVLGLVPFGLFVVGATILSGAGRMMRAAAIAGVSLLVVLAATSTTIRSAGLGEHTLVATATGTTVGAIVALLVVGLVVRLALGGFLAPMSVLRGAVAGAVGFAVAYVVPHASRLTAIAALACGFFAFLATLWISGEISPAEKNKVSALTKRVTSKAA